MRAMDILYDARDTFLDEVRYMRDDVKNTKASFATFFAIFCFGIVLVGNVVLLIAINFWLSIMPTDNLDHNSSQIAIQVVSMMFMLIFFISFVVTFIGKYGVRPLIRTLIGRGRVGGPWYRLFLLFSSGATNAISSVLAVYAITYTPQFLQAILLCAIPFSAQAWTVIFIPLERKRNYVSVFFVGSFLFFIGGIFLASTKAFTGEHERASVPWTLIYLASSVVFGLWCVVQRLYLDAVVFKAVEHHGIRIGAVEKKGNDTAAVLPDEVGAEDAEEDRIDEAVADADLNKMNGNTVKDSTAVGPFDPLFNREGGFSVDVGANDDEGVPHQRQWAQQDVYDTAAKLVLLYVGVFFQTLVTFVCFPVDAIPWFGTSDTVGDAWAAFANSVNFIFDSWFNVRYGLLYSLGFAMSFIGCTYLNEHSPTLASVVLQLAGPVTSFMIVIVPKWNVYQEDYDIGQQMGGIILLLVAAALYHFWDQHTSRALYGGGLEGDQQQQAQRAAEQTAGEEHSEAESSVGGRTLNETPREERNAADATEIPVEAPLRVEIHFVDPAIQAHMLDLSRQAGYFQGRAEMGEQINHMQNVHFAETLAAVQALGAQSVETARQEGEANARTVALTATHTLAQIQDRFTSLSAELASKWEQSKTSSRRASNAPGELLSSSISRLESDFESRLQRLETDLPRVSALESLCNSTAESLRNATDSTDLASGFQHLLGQLAQVKTDFSTQLQTQAATTKELTTGLSRVKFSQAARMSQFEKDLELIPLTYEGFGDHRSGVKTSQDCHDEEAAFW
eukprot:gene7456-5253_t